jgi:hypothetical protein
VTYYELDALYGHDTFLLDVNAIGSAVKGHIEQEPGGSARLWEDAADAAGTVRRLHVCAFLVWTKAFHFQMCTNVISQIPPLTKGLVPFSSICWFSGAVKDR